MGQRHLGFAGSTAEAAEECFSGRKGLRQARLRRTFEDDEHGVACHDPECVKNDVVNVEDADTEDNLHHFEGQADEDSEDERLVP